MTSWLKTSAPIFANARSKRSGNSASPSRPSRSRRFTFPTEPAGGSRLTTSLLQKRGRKPRLEELVNEALKAEVERLQEEVRQDSERLKSKKKALRKLEAALEELALSI